ncbi:MAG: M23 family metallopeptidase [Spirochaetia bacterium]|nr:M23 family metallopeptidase [Spirochaetia bacterium]
MSPVKDYKRAEIQFIRVIQRIFRAIGSAISGFFSAIVRGGRQHFTVMLIPHSEKHTVHNFRISMFSFVVIVFLLGCMTMSFILFTTRFTGVSKLLESRTEELRQRDEDLELIREQIAGLKIVSERFEDSLSSALDKLGLSSGDDSSLNGGSMISGGELADLESLNVMMEDSIKHFYEITGIMDAHSDLISGLPSIWPLKGSYGRFTAYFGPNQHPFTKGWYLHKGIDIADKWGTPLVATADGKVIEKGFEANGYGNYIVIKHKYGFYTKYAHLDKVYVKEGQSVLQGNLIGTMGSSGLSTGPHLHYEVRIGSQVVDPQRYLNLGNRSGL